LKRLHFLDGLRGWGAVFVVLSHVFADALPVTPESRVFLSHLVPFNGTLAVLVFFLVSGLSLSVGYLADGDRGAWIRMIAGRYFRLAIPILAACFLVYLAMIAGMIDVAAQRLPLFRNMLNFDPTAFHLLRFSLFDVFFSYRAEDTYIGPLWTMSIELVGSVLVLLAIFPIRANPYRSALLLAVALAIAVMPLPSNWPLLALFPVGAAMADWFNRGWLDRVPGPIAIVLLISGCLISAALPFSVSAWGFAAAFLVVGSIALPQVRAFLDGGLSAWLGRISFPLYLMHGPVIWVVGEPLAHGGNRFAVDLLVVAISFGAAFCFVPVNEFAIRVSRFVGRRIASLQRSDLALTWF
jgi:peptidoglycan/LPS O-acetylase OafA/YrhL